MQSGKKIFYVLKKEKIKYFVWKNTNLIENFFKGEENLDIFIHYSDHKKFKSLIKENNWIEVRSTTNNFDEIKHYLFFEYNKILHIHAYFKLFTGNTVTKDYDLTHLLNYFQNIHFNKKFNLWILNYDCQLILFKSRIFLKKKTLLGKYLLVREKNYYKLELKNIIKKINDFKNLNQKKKKIYREYKPHYEFIKSVEKFKRISFIYSKYLEVLFLIKISLKKIFGLRKFKLNNKTEIFLSGADSSGKSSICYELYLLFNKFFKTKKFTISKPFPKFLINFFLKQQYFTKKKKFKIKKNSNKDNIILLFKSINLAFLRYLYHLKIFYLTPGTNIIILDRYLSENIGDVNGPRIKYNLKKPFLNNFFSKIETFFYKRVKILDYEYRISTKLQKCLLRNKNRFKDVKKNDQEIIERYKNFSSSKFKSKKILKIDNNFSKTITINKLLYTLSKNLNENY